jgi:hypothetical protein
MPLTRRRKLILALVVVPFLLLGLLVGALLTSVVQTAAARRALAGQGEVEKVSVGLGGASLRGLRLEQAGLKVNAPAFDADIPLLDLAGGRIDVRRLVARDLVIEYDPVAAAAHAREHPAAPAEPTEPAKPFAGLLSALSLPGKLAVNGVDLAGVLRVAGPTPLTVDFSLTGGEVAAGRQGAFDLKLHVKPDASTDLATTLKLLPTLDDAGQFSALAIRIDTQVAGGPLRRPASLRTDLGVARDGPGETWTLRLVAADKNLFELDTRWAPGATDLPGRWKIAVSDADLAPFSPLPVLPVVRLSGEGDLAVSDAQRVRLSGALQLVVDALDTLGLPALGAMRLDARFGLDADAAETRVRTFQLDVASGADPVLTVAARQAFAFAPATRKLTPVRPADELVEVRLHGLPAPWLALFAPELSLGGAVTGAWSLRPVGDGVALETTAPLVLPGVRYGPPAAPLVAFDSIRVEGLRATGGPSGFDADLPRLRLIVGEQDVVNLGLTAAQKTGAPLAARIELRALLGALVEQPALKGLTRLGAGKALLVLDASAGDAQKVTADLRLTGLRAAVAPGAAPAADLPEITLQAEVNRDAAGIVTAKIPLAVRQAAPARTSDLELAVTVTPPSAANADLQLAAKLTSQNLHLPDLQAFAALAPAPAPAPAKAPSAADQVPAAPPAPAPAGPLWAGVQGWVELSLARIVCLPGLEITNTTGRVGLTRDQASLEKLQTVLGTGGRLQLGGLLRWLEASRSYQVGADAGVVGLAAGPLLKALNPAASVPLEGTFGLTATVTGAGVDPAAAAAGAAAEVKLTGRQGVIRALNLDTNRYAKLAGSKELGAIAGLLGAVAGDNELGRRAQQVAAVNGFARTLSNLSYEEFNLHARRGADGAIAIDTLGLSASELRLKGSGSLGNTPGLALADQALALRLELGAGGETARNLGVLGLLDTTAKPAPNGFLPLVEPIVLDGTLKAVGTSQLNRLINRALGL